ncbi:MAG: rhamnulokinase family protein [Candidatus Ornithospirochaeta sp.]|nr:rhamnulokinase family protein [Candidatus Ornithospirochaeta sp.]
MKRVLTIDIGASSGKMLAGWIENGILKTETVHRFPNGYIRKDGHLVWDAERLLSECIRGIDIALSKYAISSISIDTWGCDYVLLDSKGESLGDVFCYRDRRTEGASCPVSFEDLYSRTGIQHVSFNTVYQLLSDKERLESASAMLMIPDWIAYRLTGGMVQEYTNATTTSLVDAERREWDWELIDALSLPRCLFRPLSFPGTLYGTYRGIPLIAGPSHDTAAAVYASPLDEKSAFISSGTWSLLGSVEKAPILSDDARRENFTNEGGVDGTIRFLRNLMGTWMLQRVNEENGRIGFDELEKLARGSGYRQTVDIEDERFLSPESMTDEIMKAIQEKGGKKPESLADIASSIYFSLSYGYKSAIERLERLTGRSFDTIAIVGGGSRDEYLCSLTAAVSGRTVTAGPVEGSAIGSILFQLCELGECSDRDSVLRSSFDIKRYNGEVI